MEIKYYLENNNGFKWKKINNIYFKGYFTNFTENELLEKLKNCTTIIDFKKISNAIYGCFTIIYEKKDNVYIISDKLRTFPIFYSIENKKLYISDDSIYLDKLFNKERNPILLDTIKCVRYTFDNETINPYVFQTQSSEILCINRNDFTSKRYLYWKYIHKENEKVIENSDIFDIYKEVISDTIKTCNNRTIVVPLSSGQDSRIIVTLLHILNYSNVICFSYGKTGNFEAIESQKIAHHLGYKWFFIEYTKETWVDTFKSKEFDNYLAFAGGIHTTACCQQFYALKVLNERNLIPNDSIIMPGHGGDVCVGEIIPTELLNDFTNFHIDYNHFIKKISKYYYDRYYVFKGNNRYQSQMLTKLSNYFERNTLDYKKNYLTVEDIVDILHFMNFKEDESKYIINEVRNNEFFGFEWRLPLIDSRIINFWSNIPYYKRIQRERYLIFSKECIDPIANTNTSIDSLTVLPKSSIKRKLKYTKLYTSLYKFKIFMNRLDEYNKNPLCFYEMISLQKYVIYLLKWGNNFNINKLVVEKEIKNIEGGNI